MFGPHVIGAFSWPSVDDASRALDKFQESTSIDEIEKGLKGAAGEVRQKAQSTLGRAKERAVEQIDTLAEQAGEKVGRGARTSFEKSLVPWLVGGGIVAVATFVALKGRR